MKNKIKSIIGQKTIQSIKNILQGKLPNNNFHDEDLNDIQKRKLFYGQFVGNNDLCFDVGANFGNRTQPLLELGTKVVAIEPQIECCKFLKKKFGNSIILINAGLGAKEEEKDFYISDAHTLSSFSIDWVESVKKDRFKQFNWDKKVKMQMTTLDNLISKFGKPKFIKIDVEGYEYEVLKGLSEPVEMISFEYTVPEQTESIVNCINQIHANSKDIELNYCIGEDMKFELENWISVSDMINLVNTSEFSKSEFGDIYIRQLNS